MTLTTYLLRMLLGLICYHIWMRLTPRFINRHPRLNDWLLSLAGFYAYSDGYENYRRRQSR